MKPPIALTWSLCLALFAALPSPAASGQDAANSTPGGVSDTNAPSVAPANAAPDASSPAIESAPGRVVTTAAPPPTVALSGAAAEIVKLAQGGVSDEVMLSFIANSSNTFNLTSDGIIYLNDLGVSSSVVNAMIEQDRALRAKAGSLGVGEPSPAGQPEAEPEAPDQTPDTTSSADSGAPPPDADSANASFDYFYNGLAPYGTWIDMGGYGMCWQPTVVLGNPAWNPYFNHGYWVNTDEGWYWASTYSWGWAPFHYGRWFHHARFGWCWMPDTVWGPAWVSWRYTSAYCGWAPLPPAACFVPGIGFSFRSRHVGFDFDFGLSASLYRFVPIGFVGDRHPARHLVREQDARSFFHQSVIGGGGLDAHKAFLNAGIPVSHITAVTRADIPRMQVRYTDAGVGNRLERVDPGSRSVAVYRPTLPQPDHPTALVGRGIKATPGLPIPRVFASPAIHPAAAHSTIGSARNNPSAIVNPAFKRPEASVSGVTPAGAVRFQVQQPASRPTRQETPKSMEQYQRITPQPAAPVARPNQWTAPSRVESPDRGASYLRPERSAPAVQREPAPQAPAQYRSSGGSSQGSNRQDPNARRDH
jgi:hypothetical protein